MEKTEQQRKTEFYEEAVPHLDALYGTALRLTKNEGDAEDLVQETMLKAYRYFDKYQAGTNCKAWLFKILTNTFINRYRKKQKRSEFLVDDKGHRPLAERAPAKTSDPMHQHFGDQDTMFHRLFGDEVKAALEEIPVDFRMVVLLADLQDFAYKEIAEIMGCPIGTVMSRLYRGRRMLRAQLVEYAVEQGYVPAVEDEAEAEKTTSLADYRRKKHATNS